MTVRDTYPGSAVVATTPTEVITPAGVAEKPRGGFRADVQALRALAVLLVVLYHAGVPGLTGGFLGVDVFFVISGFLITGLLVREQERTGTISIVKFYGRRMRRIMPAAAPRHQIADRQGSGVASRRADRPAATGSSVRSTSRTTRPRRDVAEMPFSRSLGR